MPIRNSTTQPQMVAMVEIAAGRMAVKGGEACLQQAAASLFPGVSTATAMDDRI